MPSMVERKLRRVSEQLRSLREEMRVLEEQLAQFVDEADEARLRALVSETPAAEKEHRQAQRHADAMAKRRDEVHAEITRLESTQDDLLDRFVEERR